MFCDRQGRLPCHVHACLPDRANSQGWLCNILADLSGFLPLIVSGVGCADAFTGATARHVAIKKGRYGMVRFLDDVAAEKIKIPSRTDIDTARLHWSYNGQENDEAVVAVNITEVDSSVDSCSGKSRFSPSPA